MVYMQIFLPIDLPSLPFFHTLINLYLFTTVLTAQKLCSKGPSHKVIVPDELNMNLQTTTVIRNTREIKELHYSTYIFFPTI